MNRGGKGPQRASVQVLCRRLWGVFAFESYGPWMLLMSAEEI